MTNIIQKQFYFLIIFTILVAFNISFAQNGNNAFVFNGETSQIYVNDDDRGKCRRQSGRIWLISTVLPKIIRSPFRYGFIC